MTLVYLGTAFGAGFLASLSPCVYPMLPVTIGFLSRGGSKDESSLASRRRQVLAFFVGQTLTFTLLGVLAVRLGEIFGFSSQSRSVNAVVGALLLLMAFFSRSAKFSGFVSRFNRCLPTLHRTRRASLFTAFLFGATSSLVASPCTSPVLGGVLSQIASRPDFWTGLLQMLAFSLGLGFIFLLAGLGVAGLSWFPKSGRWLHYVEQSTPIVLVIASLYYFVAAFS